MKQMLNNLRLLILLLTLILMAACVGAYPPDREMEEMLLTHNADFSHLVEMFQQDSQLLRLNREFAYVTYDTKTNLPPQRMEEYRCLLAKLDIINIGRDEDTGDIYFRAWHQNGFIIGGSYKFYVYAKLTPSPVVDSLDVLKQTGQDAFAYKRVSDNWYLHLDIW